MLAYISKFITRDYLSLYFVGIVLLISIPIVIYSIGYIREYKTHYSIKYFWVMMILFIFSMLGVVLTNNIISFVVFWEIMSVSSFFLVIYEYRNRENIKTGLMYFIMTHISGLTIMIMFSFLYKFTGSMNFEGIVRAGASLSTSQKSVLVILAIIGFGSKAGLVPLHAWLPKAHPSAPSNISALMSGLMLKIAIYGFIRVTFMFIHEIPIIYGVIIMLIGAFSAIYSVFNALFQEDIKKLLAYSSAENIGIIFSTLGLSMIFNFYGLRELQLLTLIAALFHILNHAIFKSLLFLGAGSVLYGTGSKNMNELGGLHSKMKFTAWCTFIGTAAISAIPPLNGFASEILIFKSFIEAGYSIKNPEMVFIIFLCGIIIAITSGSVMWAMVKSFGMTFLGAPRSEKAVNTHKIPLTMNIGMGILAFSTLIFGVLSPLAIVFISKLAKGILNMRLDTLNYTFGYEITIVSGILISFAGILILINKHTSKDEKLEYNDTWGCGFNNLKPYMQYTPNGFTQPAARLVGNFALYEKEVRIKESIYLKQKFTDIVEKYIYYNVIMIFDYIAQKVIKIHYGKIQAYISYIFISLILAVVLVIKFV